MARNVKNVTVWPFGITNGGQSMGLGCVVPLEGKYFGVTVTSFTGSGLWKLKRCLKEPVSAAAGNTWIE